MEIQNNYRIQDVQRVLGIGHSTVYDHMAKGLIPKPLKIGRTSIWLKVEIDAVIDRAIEARDEVVK